MKSSTILAPQTGVGGTRTAPVLLAQAAKALLEGNVPVLTEIPRLLSGLVENAIEGFLEFLDTHSPEEIKQWEITVPRDPEDPGPDDGFVRRDLFDRKIYAHIRPDFEFLLKQERGIVLTSGQKAWIETCLEIHRNCVEALFRLAQEMDNLRPGYNFWQRARTLSKMNVLRIMRYDAGYKTLGRMHPDRNSVTFHLTESHPGFETVHGFNVKSWQSPHPPRVLAFTGKNFERITRGAVPALWHGAKDQSLSTEPRWVMVFFGHMARDKDMY